MKVPGTWRFIPTTQLITNKKADGGWPHQLLLQTTVSLRVFQLRPFFGQQAVHHQIHKAAVAHAAFLAQHAFAGKTQPLRDGATALVAGGAAVLCFAADEQLRRFRRLHGKGVLSKGLWAISRHPNYLGEIMFWFGLWFFAIGAGRNWWWTGVGAVAMLLMFLFVSIPWMERKILRTRPEYKDIVRSVSRLIPIPRKKGT